MMRDSRARSNRVVRVPEHRGAGRAMADPRGGDEHSTVTSRPRKRSWVFAALKVVWSLVVVLGSAIGLTWGASHYATTSARFAIRDVQLEGDVRVTKDQVLRESGIRLGDNLFRLDLAKARERLLANPWLSQVRITRHLPSTIAIELQEREASALAHR